jgi:peptidoglycan hydrolase-like protein with peptidoglycan-binding domain
MNYKYGSRDTEKDKGVAELQQKLKDKGYNIAVDGIYGTETQKAVTQYQTANKLKVDGIAGNETLTSLGIASKAPVKPQTTTTATQPTVAQTANQKLTQLAKGTSSNLDDAINMLYDRVINQKPFEYEPSADPTYNRYADIYARNAKLMSEDAMAQAAQLTGGYGSSYGQAVATQAYNAEMSKMNDIIPELRQQALAEHENERAKDIEALSLLLNERAYERGIYESDRNFNFNKDEFDWQKDQARQDRLDAAADRDDRREELALSAGFKSWDEYVKAVGEGYNNKIDINDFDEEYLNKAVEAWKNGGTEGLEEFFVDNAKDYSLEDLEALGNMIASMYPDGNGNKVVYPEGIDKMHSITDVENYLLDAIGTKSGDKVILDTDAIEFLDSLITYEEMRNDYNGDDNGRDTPDQYGAYLTGQLANYLRNRNRR